MFKFRSEFNISSHEFKLKAVPEKIYFLNKYASLKNGTSFICDTCGKKYHVKNKQADSNICVYCK